MFNLDILITLRCNATCRNCIEFCNMQDVTGLDYSDSDMTLGQIDHFIDQVRASGRRPVFGNVTVTGGEPLLHPDVVAIVHRLEPLVAEGILGNLCVNSNRILAPPPGLESYIINFVLPKDKWKVHRVVLRHPDDLPGQKYTYATCTQYRKNTVVLSYQGYSVCCAGDAYARLFCLDDLISQEIPERAPDGIDKVCRHCPFSIESTLPLERNDGRPVSQIYAAEAAKNAAGRTINTRFPERS